MTQNPWIIYSLWSSAIKKSFLGHHLNSPFILTTMAQFPTSYLLHSVTFSSKSIPNTNFGSLAHFWQKLHISLPTEQECCFLPILAEGYGYPRIPCNNSNYIHAPMPILTPPRNKVGAGLEPIQTCLLLERRTSWRGVATLTLWPLPHTCINSERMRQTVLVVCRTAPSASGRS